MRVDRWWRAFNVQSPACNGNAVAVLRPHIGIERRREKKSAVFVTFSARGSGNLLGSFTFCLVTVPPASDAVSVAYENRHFLLTFSACGARVEH